MSYSSINNWDSKLYPLAIGQFFVYRPSCLNYSFQDSVIDKGNWRFGGLISKYYTGRFWNDRGVQSDSMKGTKIESDLSIGKNLNLALLGLTFYIESIKELDSNVIELTCYDALINNKKFSEQFSYNDFLNYMAEHPVVNYNKACRLSDIFNYIGEKVDYNISLLDLSYPLVELDHLVEMWRVKYLDQKTYIEILRDYFELRTSYLNNNISGSLKETDFITSTTENSDGYKFDLDSNEKILEFDIDFENTFNFEKICYKDYELANFRKESETAPDVKQMYTYNITENNCILRLFKTSEVEGFFTNYNPLLELLGLKLFQIKDKKLVSGTIKCKRMQHIAAGECIKIIKDAEEYWMIVTDIVHNNDITTITGESPTNSSEQAERIPDMNVLETKYMDENIGGSFFHTFYPGSGNKVEISVDEFAGLNKPAHITLYKDLGDTSKIDCNFNMNIEYNAEVEPDSEIEITLKVFLYIIDNMQDYEYFKNLFSSGKPDTAIEDYADLLCEKTITPHKSKLVKMFQQMNVADSFSCQIDNDLIPNKEQEFAIVPLVKYQMTITNESDDDTFRDFLGHFKLLEGSKITYNLTNLFQNCDFLVREETYNLTQWDTLAENSELIKETGVVNTGSSYRTDTTYGKEGFVIETDSSYKIVLKAMDTPIKLKINQYFYNSLINQGGYGFIYIGEKEITPTLDQVKNKSDISDAYGEWIWSGGVMGSGWIEKQWTNEGKTYPRTDKELVITMGTIMPDGTSGKAELYLNDLTITTVEA